MDQKQIRRNLQIARGRRRSMPTWNLVMSNNPNGGPNSSVTENTRANIQRLLNIPAVDNIDNPKNKTADVHFILSPGPGGGYKKEIAFAKWAKALGKKIVLGMSADGRWLTGGGLIDTDGTSYSALLNETDAIISEVNPSWRVYGRFQHKVLPISEPLEDFYLRPGIKDIDVLAVGSGGGNHIAYSLEALAMITEQYPSLKCVLGAGPQFNYIKKTGNYSIEVTRPHNIFESYLKRSKVVLNIEMKPRGGRIPIWGFYSSCPTVCSSGAFYSQLFPELTFDRIDLDEIVSKCMIGLNNSNSLVTKSRELAKPFYIDSWKKTVYDFLGLK